MRSLHLYTLYTLCTVYTWYTQDTLYKLYTATIPMIIIASVSLMFFNWSHSVFICFQRGQSFLKEPWCSATPVCNPVARDRATTRCSASRFVTQLRAIARQQGVPRRGLQPSCARSRDNKVFRIKVCNPVARDRARTRCSATRFATQLRAIARDHGVPRQGLQPRCKQSCVTMVFFGKVCNPVASNPAWLWWSAARVCSIAHCAQSIMNTLYAEVTAHALYTLYTVYTWYTQDTLYKLYTLLLQRFPQ